MKKVEFALRKESSLVMSYVDLRSLSDLKTDMIIAMQAYYPNDVVKLASYFEKLPMLLETFNHSLIQIISRIFTDSPVCFNCPLFICSYFHRTTILFLSLG